MATAWWPLSRRRTNRITDKRRAGKSRLFAFIRFEVNLLWPDGVMAKDRVLSLPIYESLQDETVDKVAFGIRLLAQ